MPSICKRSWVIVLSLAGVGLASKCLSQESAPVSTTIAPDATVQFNASVPPSDYLSDPARQYLKDFVARGGFPKLGSTLEESRRNFDELVAKPLVAQWRKLYPVDIRPEMIGGVLTDVITPENGPVSKTRILINLHGGGFMLGARYGGQSESIPMSGVGHVKVVTVDYRQGPENHFPAASEDVAAVYKALLKTYKASNIGIYGCSSGGLLAAQSVAWIQAHGLPTPGALGIFCAGAMPIRDVHSDSASVWQSLMLLGVSLDGGATALNGAAACVLARSGEHGSHGLARHIAGGAGEVPAYLAADSTRDPWLSNAVVTHARSDPRRRSQRAVHPGRAGARLPDIDARRARGR